MKPKPWSESEKIIYHLLARGPKTHGDLVSQCTLCPRTIRYSLSRLNDRGILTQKLHYSDLRRIIYSLNLTPLGV